MKKLEDTLAAKDKEVAALKDSAQKATAELTDLRASLRSKDGEIKTLADAKTDLQGKLAGLESTLEAANIKTRLLSIDLEETKRSQKAAEQNMAQLEKSIADWTAKLVGIAERLSAQLAVMDVGTWSFNMDSNQAVSTTLSLFFEGLLAALDAYHKGRAKKFADESRILVRNVVLRILSKVVHYNPDVDMSNIFKKLPDGPELEAARQAVTPIADKVAERCIRVEGTLRH